MDCRNQEYDVTGISGNYYCLISDLNLILNAKFSTAYSTGMYIDDNSVVWPMRPKGTWMSEVGLRLADNSPEDPSVLLTTNLVITASKMLTERMGGIAQKSMALKYGSVVIDGVAASAGTVVIRDSISVNVFNNKQYTRVSLNAPDILSIEFDIVPPPANWQLSEEEQADYSHVNLKLIYANLSNDAHGLIGVSKDLKYDTNGEAVRGFILLVLSISCTCVIQRMTVLEHVLNAFIYAL